MKPKKFNIQSLIASLLNTKDDILPHLPFLMRETDLTNKDINAIFEVAFRCNCCNTWTPKEEESSDKEEHCVACVDENNVCETINESYHAH